MPLFGRQIYIQFIKSKWTDVYEVFTLCHIHIHIFPAIDCFYFHGSLYKRFNMYFSINQNGLNNITCFLNTYINVLWNYEIYFVIISSVISDKKLRRFSIISFEILNTEIGKCKRYATHQGCCFNLYLVGTISLFLTNFDINSF